MILHPGTLYYVPNIVLNFHLDCFITFWYTWSFMFHHFSWKLPIQGQFLRALGVNGGQISFFHFITPKGTSLRDFASFEPYASKNPLTLYVGPRKKINKKSYKKLHFTPLPRSPPWTDFYEFWTSIPLVDIISRYKLCVNLFKDFDFTGVKVSIFPIAMTSEKKNSKNVDKLL